RVFGSFARNEVRPESDLDLLIEAGPNTTPFFPGGLIADLEEELGRKVDVVEEEALHHLLRDRIQAEAVPLFERCASGRSTALSGRGSVESIHYRAATEGSRFANPDQRTLRRVE